MIENVHACNLCTSLAFFKEMVSHRVISGNDTRKCLLAVQTFARVEHAH